MSFLSSLNPIPQFPPYKGPYNVGSVELEIPSSTLTRTPKVATIHFRLFYPTTLKPAGTAPVYWLPEPHQREYLSGYARFLGASAGLASFLSYLPRTLYHISVPVIADAALRPSASRYPTMLFSHGLGGTRMAYSYLCASIAASGVVVVAVEHRDGSCPVTFITHPGAGREEEVEGDRPEPGEPTVEAPAPTVQVEYTAYKHIIDPEVHRGRDGQLTTRIWELGMAYRALRKLDGGEIRGGEQFAGKLDVVEPGRVVLAGHSFGASTVVQFMKAVHYGEEVATPLCERDFADDMRAQFRDTTPMLLLDLWCLPLLSPSTHRLFVRPLPQRREHGDRVLAVMSQEFLAWQTRGVRRMLSIDPGRRRGTTAHRDLERWEDADGDGYVPGTASGPEPALWYVRDSAHMSHSDFPVLFPRVAGRKARDHEEILDLNCRATVGWLRGLGYEVELEGAGVGSEVLGSRWGRVGLQDGDEGIE